MSFILIETELFLKSLDNYRDKKGNLSNELKKRLIKTLEQLVENPSYKGLKSHIVNSPKVGVNVWSSTVSGDLRLIWDYDKDDKIRILLLKLGGHTGKNKVY
jgi:mRNA-degrading endonuclease YafQ of YafQ-DinJ toxin-antitoxin module